MTRTTTGRLAAALGVPIIAAGLIGGAVAFASDGGGGSAPEPRTITLQEPAPEDGGQPKDHSDCPNGGGGGESGDTSASGEL